MNAYLKAYINKNLGDDIFIKLISERYPNINFLISEDAKYLSLKNVTYIRNDLTINKVNNILKILSFGLISYQSIQMKKCDISIVIGGSMFIESRNKIKNFISLLMYKKPFDYVIGVNFGPFYSKKFLKKYYKFFEKTKDVCFRDYYSYNLFNKIKNTRIAPDLVFSLDKKKYNITNRKRVIISVIDCDRRFDSSIAKNYYEKICEIIKYYRELKYEICLMSFCKKEGDEEAINKILSLLDENKYIETYFYDGNIEEAINEIADSEIVVGTRFHANIIGMVLDKKVIPISYSDKTINVLNDMNFKGINYDIRKINSFDISKLKDLDDKNIYDVTELNKISQGHFEKLDELIEKQGGNTI